MMLRTSFSFSLVDLDIFCRSSAALSSARQLSVLLAAGIVAFVLLTSGAVSRLNSVVTMPGLSVSLAACNLHALIPENIYERPW